MKKNLLWILLAVGITVSAFGSYYLHKSNYFVSNNQMPENALGESSESSEKPEAEKPGEALEWRLLAWRDENGYIPPNGLSEAIRQRDEYLRRQTQQQTGIQTGKQATTEVASRLNWVSRGPQNVGGRTRSLIAHPNNANLPPDQHILWAGSVSGGVWKSTDGGTNWVAMNGNLQNYAISSMAMDPNNPNVLYVGTGEGFFNLDAVRGAGIFRTTDGGMTWNLVPGTDQWHWVDRISIAHDNSNLILAATRGGIRRSTDGGSTWILERGADASLYVAFNPTDSSKAVADVIEGGYSRHRTLYSTDGGDTWQNSNRDGSEFVLNFWLDRIELAYSRSSPNIVYALFPSAGGGTIARSTDGGQNFTTKTSQSDASIGASWYNNTLWVSPTDPNFIVAGGFLLSKSTNGGDNFTQISNGYIMTVQPHVDMHCIVSDPGYSSTNKRVYVCNDGGVYRTDDITTANRFGTGGWERKELTYQTTQYYGGAGHGATGLIYGGTQDNGTLRSLSGGQNAELSSGGDGGFSAVDPNDSNYCYGEYIYLQIHRSSNCSSISPPPSAQDIYNGISDAGNGSLTNFIAPFILDPNQPNRMLAGGRSLWRTNNVKTGNPPTWDSIRAGGTANISAIAVKQGTSDDSKYIWIAQNDGKVYKTETGLATSPTWLAVDDNGGTNPLPPARMVTRILIDKDNSQIVYIAFGGFSDDNLWRTTNGGATWTEITPVGFPSVPIRGIARHPTNASKLYLGTEIGVFTTDNGGTTWNTVVDGPANVSVDEVVFMSNSTKLLAATHGRGVWITDVDDTTITDHALFDFDADGRTDFSVFRPSNGTWYLERSREGFQSVQFGLATDKPVARDYDGDGKADIAVWRPSNGYWYRLNSSDSAFVAVQFGQDGDVPVPADFDDDGKADQAVFRPSDNGYWYLNRSTAGYTAIDWGQLDDLPTAADFDGDDKADLAVFRPSDGTWYLLQSTSGEQYIQFGQNGDIPVAADYDGDGKADTAVFRPSNGVWYLNRTTAGFLGFQWGLSSDKLVPADYDGDGKADIAVWRPTDGTWYLVQSTNGYRFVGFGTNGDVPIPAVP